MGQEVTKFSDQLRQAILSYMGSDQPGGKQVIGAFLEEFEDLSDRSPQDDPTNIKNHLGFIVKHLKETWDESLRLTEDGSLEVGLCKDEVLGYTEDRTKLLHTPVPVAWLVYLIRGIGGRYAFVGPDIYFAKKGEPMPAVYNGGFLISESAWEREGWYTVGSFEQYEHPASGASPIPFFRDAMEKVDIQSIVSEAINKYEGE